MTKASLPGLCILLLACGTGQHTASEPLRDDAGASAQVHLGTVPIVPAVPAIELKRYQGCRADGDCILTHVGCCRGRNMVAIAADKLNDFRARTDCSKIEKCPTAGDGGGESARCVDGFCKRVGAEEEYGIEF